MEYTQEMRDDMLAMSKGFKKRTVVEDQWEKITDLRKYITDMLVSDRALLVGREKIKIAVGTDSKFHPRGSRTWSVSYVTVIGFTFGNRGTHLIARRDKRSGDGRLSLFDRLWTEVRMTVDLALWMREELGIDPEVHFDVNPKKEHDSNIVYQAAKGYGESFGFKVEVKPAGTAAIAAVAADHFVRNKY